MSLTVDVDVPVHGGWALTELCLASLARQAVPHRAIVVDNRSPDDTVERVRSEWPDVMLVELGANRGFAVACNAAMARTDGDLVVLVNNDIEADNDFLGHLRVPFEENARCGMVAPLLLRPGRDRIDSVGIVADPTLAAFARLQGRPVADAGAEDGRLLGPIGAAAAYRRSALAEVGLLDERIFMYGEGARPCA